MTDTDELTFDAFLLLCMKIEFLQKWFTKSVDPTGRAHLNFSEFLVLHYLSPDFCER